MTARRILAHAVGAVILAAATLPVMVSDAGARASWPHCTTEDSTTGPCTWNIGPGVDGNGAGLAYWVDRDGHVHYLAGAR